jgi:hypothetical protein
MGLNLAASAVLQNMARGASWGRKRAPSESSGCPEY